MTDTLITFFSNQLQHIGEFGYIIAFVIALAETVIGLGMITPGSTLLLLLGGYTATTGTLDFFDLVFFATLGAILGDNINYYLGKKFGKKWIKTGVWIVKPAHFKLGYKFFKKNGGKSVFLGRFIPMAKEVTPFIAGMMRMNHFQFFLFNVLGGIGWGFEFLGLGFIFAGSILLAKVWLGRITFLVFLILFFFFLLSVFEWILKKYGQYFFQSLYAFLNSFKNFWLQKNFVQKFILNHPKFILFLKERFSSKSFLGLPLTTLSLFFLYFLFSFTDLVEAFITGDTIIQIDERLENLLYLFRHKTLISFFLWVTLLGKSQIVLFFSSFMILTLFLIKQKKEILPLIFSLVSASGLIFLTKIFFHRPRPHFAFYTEHSYSFPSGHATIAVAFYGFLAWLLIQKVKQWKSKVNIAIFTVAIIFLIGFSRLYLGVHYLSDVLGGFSVGAMALIFAIAISEYLSTKNFVFNQRKISNFSKIIIIFLCCCSIGFYIFTGLNYKKDLLLNLPVAEQNREFSTLSQVFHNQHLKFTETITGQTTEPLNFIFIAQNQTKIEDLFALAQWEKSDTLTITTSLKMLDNILGGQAYETAPVTPLFWNGEIQNFTFQQLPNKKSIRTRHHIRIWKTPFLLNQKRIFVGCAIFDIGLKWGITHRIAEDIDNEREAVFLELKKTKKIKNSKKIQFVKPYQGTNFSGDKFVTDGESYVLEL